jgi:hypothetical protein
LSEEKKIHLKTGSTPLSYEGKEGNYFVQYDENTYGLLEILEGEIFPIKNCV